MGRRRQGTGPQETGRRRQEMGSSPLGEGAGNRSPGQERESYRHPRERAWTGVAVRCTALGFHQWRRTPRGVVGLPPPGSPCVNDRGSCGGVTQADCGSSRVEPRPSPINYSLHHLCGILAAKSERVLIGRVCTGRCLVHGCLKSCTTMMRHSKKARLTRRHDVDSN